MIARISPGRAEGTVLVPTSKSMAHRLLICGGLCRGSSVIHGVSDCEDVQATLDCLRAMGAECSQQGSTVRMRGVDLAQSVLKGVLPCRESGSTLRFLIPSLLLRGGEATFTGYGRLMERPMSVYEELCRARGLTFRRGNGSITVGGGLFGDVYTLAGDVSSQFISGLLFALPMAREDSVIELLPPVESRSYILMTLDAMRAFGVEAHWEGEDRIRIPGGQCYQPREVTVEGDYSNAAFTDALNHLGGSVRVEGLREDSLQGDRCYREAMAALDQGRAEISLRDCPDLGPILFAVAAARHGGVFTETRRLRIKESDRVAAMQTELAKLGVKMDAEEDRVTVWGGALRAPTESLNGHNDHRIVMALAVLLTKVGGEILGAEAVRKSYTGFFRDLRELGIPVEEIV